MISRMLGAPLGGTTRGGYQGVESVQLSLIVPPNFGAGGGSWFPSIVVVASGEPGTPVTCCAMVGAVASRNAAAVIPVSLQSMIRLIQFIGVPPSGRII